MLWCVICFLCLLFYVDRESENVLTFNVKKNISFKTQAVIYRLLKPAQNSCMLSYFVTI